MAIEMVETIIAKPHKQCAYIEFSGETVAVVLNVAIIFAFDQVVAVTKAYYYKHK